MNETERLVELLVDASDLLKAIYGQTQEAHNYQWQTPKRQVAPEPEDAGTHADGYRPGASVRAGTIRQKGVISDPTSRIVVDDARWALRGSLVEAERLLAAVVAGLTVAKDGLEQGLRPYQNA